MSRDQTPALLPLVGFGLLVVLCIWGTILVAGVAVAIAKGTIPVSALVIKYLIIGGGTVGGTYGAVKAVSVVSKKRRSAFIAMCSLGDWFVSDSIGDLYLENHSDFEKNLFKFTASLMFALASGLWAQEKWPRKKWLVRAVSILLYLAPTGALALKIWLRQVQLTLSGYQLSALLVVPLLLAGIYIAFYSWGILTDD